MHTEEQLEAAWQKTVADMAAESQRRVLTPKFGKEYDWWVQFEEEFVWWKEIYF
jgi:hypothetical protein